MRARYRKHHDAVAVTRMLPTISAHATVPTSPANELGVSPGCSIWLHLLGYSEAAESPTAQSSPLHREAARPRRTCMTAVGCGDSRRDGHRRARDGASRVVGGCGREGRNRGESVFKRGSGASVLPMAGGFC
jgi:hypothetical protein